MSKTSRKLPIAVAVATVSEKRMREDLMAATFVLQEAFAQLTAHLHARGAVDGYQVVEALQRTMSAQELVGPLPGSAGLAEILVGRTLHALEERAGDEPPPPR